MPISHNHTKFEYPDYIAPLPADDLVKIALKKQELYDQGIAQIQSQVDAYTDLRNNIYTDAEKAYFDESMTKYVKAINDSAGLDFSKKANLNAVLNIGKPLEKDKNIINAIQNGKEIQRRQKALNELDQSKRSAANDWFYMNDVQDYLSANKLGVSLSKDKAYTEFYDISDKVMDYVKTLSKEQQDEFFTTGDGTPTGYIQKISQQGFSQTKLANRIKGMLATDPKAMQQLSIDARYNFNNLGKENAYQGYIEDQTIKEAAVTDQITQTQSALAQLQQSNARVKSPAVDQQIKELQQNLTELTQYQQQLSKNTNISMDQFDMNDYFETYQNKFITNLSNTYATQKISRDLKDDKVWDNMQKYNFEAYKASLDIKKEKAKAKIEEGKVENLLKKRQTIWKMGNVAPEDLVVLPKVISDSSTNLDIDQFKLGDVMASERSLKVAPLEQKRVVSEFFKYLTKGKVSEEVQSALDALETTGTLSDADSKTINKYKNSLANRTFVVNFKNGDAEMVTGTELFDSYLQDFKFIESIAQTNTIQEFSSRKKTPEFNFNISN